MMFGGLGVQEILVILIVGLVVFGARKLPEIGRSLGKGINEFKNSIKGNTVDVEHEKLEEPQVKYIAPKKKVAKRSR